MADRIITVTNPSVVTNDTLASYNNYSDVDGLLGSMTPTEAANGKTVTLSDGSVHQVTTKPVGTTNGEFTAVVSNSVEVDLSTGVLAPLELDIQHSTLPLVESPAGTWAGAAGAGALASCGCRSTPIAGDFEYVVDWVNISNYSGWGLDVTNTPDDTTFTNMDIIIYGAAPNVKLNNATETLDPGGDFTQGADRKVRLTRASGNMTLHYFDGSNWQLRHTFPVANNDTLYPWVCCEANDTITNPMTNA